MINRQITEAHKRDMKLESSSVLGIGFGQAPAAP